MQRIQVWGAGECGLTVAHRLLQEGRPVTLVADRSAEEVLTGSVTGTRLKFPATLDLEASARLGVWREQAPPIVGFRFSRVVERTCLQRWAGYFSRPAQSVDERTVFSEWLTGFLEAGGDLEIGDLSAAALDRRAGDYDLNVVTRASGELAECFPTNTDWRLPRQPQRNLTVLYLDAVAADARNLGSYITLPGLGEVVSYRGLTGAPGYERPCEIVIFAAIPGRELDVFTADSAPLERLQAARTLLTEHFPAEMADRYRHAELTDAGATLVGSVTPAVRHPVGILPSGGAVLGGGGVLCWMDPCGAQGVNNAVQCGFRYAEAILDRGEAPFDRNWMHRTAAEWLTTVAYPAMRWTLALLDPTGAVPALVQAAQHDTALADAFADTFTRPASMTSMASAGSAPARAMC